MAIKEKGRSFFRKPVVFLLGKLPKSIRRKLIDNIKRKMEGQYAETGKQTEQRAEKFLVQEGMLVFWGVILLAIFIGGITVYRLIGRESLVFERNSFGEGKKEVSVVLQKEKQQEEYSLTLEEQELSLSEEQRLKEEFFHELKIQMTGENASLQKVSQKLSFEESLTGWPFHITYVPKDAQYLLLDGNLGEKGTALKEGETIHTGIYVTAEYNFYTWSREFEVVIIREEEKRKDSPFADAVRNLTETEKETRKEKIYTVPSLAGGVTAGKKDEVSLSALLLFGITVLALLIFRNISDIKNGEKNCRKETLRDFPIIVHLLALYMGAGLSFPSAVNRISKDYMSRPDGRKTYAFEEILRMDTCLRLGEGQREACMQWGRRFKEPVYQKLSLTLLQVMAKGTREGRALMNHMEQEAFRQRIDQAKKEGEEASTKLLFPMILLLGMVMILVMFPAIVRFQGF